MVVQDLRFHIPTIQVGMCKCNSEAINNDTSNLNLIREYISMPISDRLLIIRLSCSRIITGRGGEGMGGVQTDPLDPALVPYVITVA